MRNRHKAEKIAVVIELRCRGLTQSQADRALGIKLQRLNSFIIRHQIPWTAKQGRPRAEKPDADGNGHTAKYTVRAAHMDPAFCEARFDLVVTANAAADENTHALGVTEVQIAATAPPERPYRPVACNSAASPSPRRTARPEKPLWRGNREIIRSSDTVGIGAVEYTADAAIGAGLAVRVPVCVLTLCGRETEAQHVQLTLAGLLDLCHAGRLHEVPVW